MLTKSRILICGIPVDPLTMKETVDKIDLAISEKRNIHHVVINAAKMVNAQKDEKLKKAICDCDIINADGQAIVWASKILGKPVPERVAGIDLMEELVKLAFLKGYKLFLLGASEDVVSNVSEFYSQKFGDRIIAGYQHGYFSEEEEFSIARKIGESKADILFVAMSSPKKEVFLDNYKNTMNLPFIMGVGGSFDVVSGKIKRAPRWMQIYGLEWFYRVLQEPKRMWKRYLFTNTRFVFLISKEMIKNMFFSLKPILINPKN